MYRTEAILALLSRATRANVDLAPPRVVVHRPLRRPVERVALDLGERPAHRAAARIRTFLYNILAASAARLLREEIRRRVVPEDAPRVESRVVDPQRRAIPIAGARELLDVRLSVSQARNHPDILDRSALQHPAGVYLAATVMCRAVLGKSGDVE